jgi:hypothetical protein
MPLTWFAHQVPVLGVKLARPRWVDATAICVGSMMPDLMYSFSSYVDIDTHAWSSAYAWGLPLTVAVALVVRYVTAPGGACCLPDAGQFRFHSFGVLDRRRPHAAVTLVSASAGIASHVVTDWFTHPGRPGVKLLGYDDVTVTLFGRSEPLAGVLQLIGHSLGSLLGAYLLWRIGRDRLLERWYGAEAVARARQRRPLLGGGVFWATVVGAGVVGVLWGHQGDRLEQIQRPAVAALGGATIAAGLSLIVDRRSAENAGGDLAE